MATSVAERSRAFHTRRRAAMESEQRAAYQARREEIAKAKVGTVRHFKKWAGQHRYDNGDLVVLDAFQLAFVRDLFLGKPVNWFILPEGNGKTTLIALLAKYFLEFYFDAKIPVGASSRDQAGLTYDQLEGFITRAKDDDVPGSDGFELHPGLRRIDYLPTRSELKIYAADDKTGDGVIPYPIALLDELHRHRDLRLYRTWRGKLDKRGAQLVVISTAGEPGTEFEQTRERIRQDTAAEVTRKGCFTRAISRTVVFHEWAVPEDADVEDVKLVKASNPLKTITVAKLRDKLEEPGMTLTHWKRFVCNIATRSDAAAISEAEWARALTTQEIPEGERIWLGMDLAWQWDTTAIVPMWRVEDVNILGPAKVLTPPRDGSMLDPHEVERALTEIYARNPFTTVVMDPSKALQLGAWIVETFGAEVVTRTPTPVFAVQDYERFMEGLRTGKVRHTGDEGLTKHALNAIARMDRFGSTRFDRKSPTRNATPDQERRVIDALTAAAMVNAQSLVEVDGPTVYEEREMVAFG